MAARFVSLLLLGVLLFSTRTGARPQPPVDDAGVTGYVLTPDEAPVSGGTVAAYGMRSGASIEPNGRFRLLPTRPGVFQLVVSVPGFVPFRVSVKVPPSRAMRLPVIRLSTGANFRVRFVSAAGEPILAPQLRRRVFGAGGEPLEGPPGNQTPYASDTDGAVTIGPLPRGILTLAVDMPFFARTRLPDVSVSDPARDIDGGTVAVQQPGGAVHVDVTDGSGAPVPNHEVRLEDARPRSPLEIRPERTDAKGRVTFDRLGAGQYRVSTVARCNDKGEIPTTRVVPVSANGTVNVPLVISGRATFHVTSPLGPVAGATIGVAPNNPPPPLPFPPRPGMSGCPGVTDGNGRATLTNFPPGPAHVNVRMPNSTFTRQVEVPIDDHADDREVPIIVPDGFLPVHVVNEKNEPVPGATITWAGSGGRVEGTATVTGDALLEGVGITRGTLSATARGYGTTDESFAEPPGVIHTVVLTPLPKPTNLRARVTTTAGDAMRDAVVELVSSDLAAVPRVAATSERGVVLFDNVPAGSSQLTAIADGFMMSTIRVAKDAIGDAVLTLARGYRAIVDVQLPRGAGPQLVRVRDESNRSVDAMLDDKSDRRVEPPGRLSLGPLASGTYAIELQGLDGGRRQERVRIVDRDVALTLR